MNFHLEITLKDKVLWSQVVKEMVNYANKNFKRKNITLK